MILRYLTKKQWALIGVVVLLVMVQVYLDLKIPDYMTQITTIIESHGTTANIMNQGWQMIACALGSLAASLITGGIAAWIAASLCQRLRALEFDQVESFAAADMNRFSTDSLITRSTNDITQIQTAVAMGMQVMVKAPILAVWAIYKISDKSLEWCLALAVAILIMAAAVGLILHYVMPKIRRIQDLTDDVGRVLSEDLTGQRVVRAYNAKSFQQHKFDEANGVLTRTNLYINRAMSPMMPAMTAIMSILTLSVYWIGAYLINNASSSIQQGVIFANMVVFSAYAMQVISAFILTVIIFFILPRAIVAGHRVEEVIDTEPIVKDGPATESPTGRKGEIEFSNVGFKYPGAADYVLKDISFTAKKGETVAFIGSTGCGKSTLINLVPRFYDVTEGSVKVDGLDVREYTQEALHAKMGYVPQKAIIFTGTVDSNVRYGSTAGERTEDDVRQAIEVAQASDFVARREKGLEAPTTQYGTNFSGGQKQRLAIARAVCRRPEFYIFDDSFSALDYKTDRALRTALKKDAGGVTTLIVAQRIGTIMDADRIVVLENGRVAGIGTHRDLLHSCQVYREIARSQLSAEELDL